MHSWQYRCGCVFSVKSKLQQKYKKKTNLILSLSTAPKLMYIGTAIYVFRALNDTCVCTCNMPLCWSASGFILIVWLCMDLSVYVYVWCLFVLSNETIFLSVFVICIFRQIYAPRTCIDFLIVDSFCGAFFI